MVYPEPGTPAYEAEMERRRVGFEWLDRIRAQLKTPAVKPGPVLVDDEIEEEPF